MPKKSPTKRIDRNGEFEMSEKAKEDEILRLIRFVDSNKRKLFKNLDVLSGSWGLLFGLVAVYIVIISVYTIEKISVVNILTVGLAFFAVVISTFSLLVQFAEETIVEANFKRMMKLCLDEGKNLEEKDRLLLKALIKMKVKNKEFDLEQIYNMNKSMFSKEKLLERLYE